MSVLFREDLQVQLLCKVVQQDHQVIAVTAAGLTIIGAYLAPGMTAKSMNEILQ